jgi:hypothetical protein
MLEFLCCVFSDERSKSVGQTCGIKFSHNAHSFEKTTLRHLRKINDITICLEIFRLHFLVLFVDIANSIRRPLIGIKVLHAVV